MRLPKNWRIVAGKLQREFEFANFKETIAFVNTVAEIAEDMNHHPDMLIHSYKKLTVEVWTHEAQSTTNKDYELATQIENLFQIK